MKNDEMLPRETSAPRPRGRICVVTGILTTGGSDRLLHAIWSRFVLKGYAVDLYSLLPPTPYGSQSGRFKEAGITVHQPGGWLRFPLIAFGLLVFAPVLLSLPVRCRFQRDPVIASAKEIYRRIEEEIITPVFGDLLMGKILLAHRRYPFRLVSGYHDSTCPFLLRLRERLGIPVCYTEISSPKWRRMVAPGKERAGILNSLDRILVPSGIIGRELEEYEGLTAGYTVIPFFVDLPGFPYHPPEGPARTLGCIARLSREKNQDRLIRLFADVVKVVPEARLILVGKGPQEGEFKDLASRCGLSPSIEFIPWFRDIKEIMGLIDIFILLSDAEGMPISVIEAMYFGKPVIATTVGSLPEMVIPGQNGYLFPREALHGVAPAIVRIMEDEPAFREMSKNSREVYGRYFDPERHFSLLFRMYEDLMNNS